MTDESSTLPDADEDASPSQADDATSPESDHATPAEADESPRTEGDERPSDSDERPGDATDETPGTTDQAAETAGETADASDEYDGLLSAARRRAPYPETSRSVLYALVGIVVISLVMRLVWLGARVAHQDEGRVGYWIIRYLESGVWEYRAIVHGPFLFHVNKWVFGFLGPSDFTSRLVVAVVGASLPLVAWLFRKHLRDTELLALGLLLALNPVLVYYSRFMRNDVPLALFMLAALGFAVRYYDEGDYRYVFAAVGSFALGMTTKENGLLYAACWLGAALLLLDHRLFAASHADADRGPVRTALAYGNWLLPVDVRRAPETARRLWHGESSARDDARDGAARTRRWLAVNWRALGVAAVAVVEFFAVIVFFYAPRGGGYLKPGGGGPPGYDEETTAAMGLYSSIEELVGGDPSMFVAVVEEATVGTWQEFTSVWGGHEHSYVRFAEHYVEVMLAGALVVSVFGVVGFLVDRYGDGGPRDLVALCGYWGFVSVLGYPIATDIRAGWATTHAIVPLAIPAAVGVAILFRWGIESYTLDDGVGMALAAFLVVLAFGMTGMTVVDHVYQNPQDPENPIIQYAQPSTDSKPTLARVEQVGLERGGPDDVDAMFWGEEWAVTNESGLNQPPAPGGYYGRRTWMWYMEMYQYNANQSGEHFVYSDTKNASVLEETRPPVVITLGQNRQPRVPKDGGEQLHEWLEANGYERVSHQRYGDDPESEYTRPILFYIRVNPNETTDEGPFGGARDPWRSTTAGPAGEATGLSGATTGQTAAAVSPSGDWPSAVVDGTASRTTSAILDGTASRTTSAILDGTASRTTSAILDGPKDGAAGRDAAPPHPGALEDERRAIRVERALGAT